VRSGFEHRPWPLQLFGHGCASARCTVTLMISSATATAAQQGGCRRRGATLLPDVCRCGCRSFLAVSSPMDVLSSALRDDEDGNSLVSTLLVPFMP
jgi:hypothetical protein